MLPYFWYGREKFTNLINYPTCTWAVFVYHSVHCKWTLHLFPMDFHVSQVCEDETIFQFHRATHVINYYSAVILWNKKIKIVCRERIIRIKAYLKWISSPSSAGRLRNLLLDISSVRRFINKPISFGSLNKLLSLRYNAVKCSNCHSDGLTFRTLPKKKNVINIY